MQPQVPPPVQAPRFDTRSLIAAGLCLLAMFSDVFGWVFAIAGIVMLRRAVFSPGVKWLLGGVALGSKILIIGVRSLNAPKGLSFPIEPRNLITSPSLWTSSLLMAAFGVYLILQPRLLARDPNAPAEPRRRWPFVVALVGFLAVGAAAFRLLGLMDGFHRIDDAGQGRWALRHAARGEVATFKGSELASIDATERRRSRGPRDYNVRVALADGRAFSVATQSAEAVDELRKFATTADLAPGKVRIVRRLGGNWTNGASGFALKDCVGRYETEEAGSRYRGAIEFWLDNERLTGKETVADGAGRRVRLLRNIKVSDGGQLEFDPAPYVEASQQGEGRMAFSFGFGNRPETGRFVKGGLEIGLTKYRKQ